MQNLQPTIHLTRIDCYDETDHDGQESAGCPGDHLWTVILRIDGQTVSVASVEGLHVYAGRADENADIPA